MNWSKFRKIVLKYTEYFLTKIKILYAQHSYEYNGVSVKYLLKRKKNADTLVIVFSSCTRKGIKARYNYVKTLDGLECNRLHILDDYAEDGRGSYYLGKNFTFSEEKATDKLIENVITNLSPKKIIYCGSSKGGYAALNFGLKRENAYLVVGGPQYYLASYLKGSEDNCTYRHIVGTDSEEKEKMIDYYLQERIRNNPYIRTQNIYIHYSINEHTYQEHICYLLQELKKNGYRVEEDVETYTNHSDISYYFPDYLKKTVKRIMEH